jgi:hypothetical protein
LACEDWTGLWEPLWALNTIAPAVAIKERERLAAAAIRNLRDAGYITFVRMAWPPVGEPEKVAPEEVETALQGDGWRQIPPDCDVWFGATATGEAAYFRLGAD